jgi:two-component system CheB/CheR fusion protein
VSPLPKRTVTDIWADLLGRDTKMKVVQAADDMPLERDGVYVIPPQAYLSVRDGMLRISQTETRHGARLPFVGDRG